MNTWELSCVELTGSRVRLRPFDLNHDIERFFEFHNNDENLRYYGFLPMKTVDEAESYLKDYIKGYEAGTSIHWAIIDVESGLLIGDAGIFSIDKYNFRASSYCILDKSFWGKGLSADAMTLVFNYIFSNSPINRIQAHVDTRNKRTTRSIQGIGFVYEGLLRDYEYDRDEFIDIEVYSITRRDWMQRKHVLFQSKYDLSKISWQRYSINGSEYIWIYNSETRKYSLLSCQQAKDWINDPNPDALDEASSFTNNDDRTRKFLDVLIEAGITYEVHWDITYACNSCCKHCYNPGAQNGLRVKFGCNEMPLDECKEMLYAFREMGVFRIVFSGGEPTVHFHFINLIKIARELGFQVVLYTNGLSLDNEIIERLSCMGLTSVGVSVYGATPEVHDYITGIKGSFSRSINTIAQFTKHGVHTVMKFVLLHANFKDVDKMIELGTSYSDYYMNFVFYPGMDGGSQASNQMLRLTDLVTLALNPLLEVFFKKKSFKWCRYEQGREYACGRPNLSLYVNPEGSIFPCIAIPASAGNWRDYFTLNKCIVHKKNECSNQINYWRNLQFKDIPECGKHEYCDLCFSACPGDSRVICNDERNPAINHCRIAIARHVAMKWIENGNTVEDWNSFSKDEQSVMDFIAHLGITDKEYVVDGIR